MFSGGCYFLRSRMEHLRMNDEYLSSEIILTDNIRKFLKKIGKEI